MNIMEFIEALESYSIDFESVLEGAHSLAQYDLDDVVKINDRHKSARKYPVYVILYEGDAPLSVVIKKITKSQFSHASISFDLSMQYIFSFGTHEYDINKNPLGIKLEKFSGDDARTIDGLTGYRLYVTFVSKDEYLRMKNKLNDIIGRQQMFKFNIAGLARQIFNIEHEESAKYFCSQFVATVLKSGNNDIIASKSSVTKPSDFTKFDNFYRVCGGYINDYNRKEAERKVKEIYKTKILGKK